MQYKVKLYYKNMHTEFQFGNLKCRNHRRDISFHGRIILKRNVKKKCVRELTEFNLRTGLLGGPL
jgi:hypothetical protein